MSVPDAEYQKALAEIKHLKGQLAAVISERDGHRGYAETVTRLRTENERLREALAPEPIPDMATVERSMADCKAGRCQPIQEVIDELGKAAALNPPGDELITCPGCGLIDDLDGFDSGGSESGVICCRCGCEPPPAEGGGP